MMILLVVMMMRRRVVARSKLAARKIAVCFILYNLSVWDKIQDKICTPGSRKITPDQRLSYDAVQRPDGIQQAIIKLKPYLKTSRLLILAR